MNSFRSGLFFLTASLSIGNQSFLFKALDTRIVETHIKNPSQNLKKISLNDPVSF
ncbi:hypothetical protein LEP1GSC125_1788 [Leptospira mayottensis 200901122]|uniref:Uncharacterized protein n=1 Tax=Leptospira mayottensis 200901122 TaxID=1193010 RepID=A0AA87MMV0_9LEPT|nr:hypothetical protein LEP1GSC125_1788 [Leptospira mayottensis 200901122]